MPHATFNGQTPDEIYFDKGDAVVIDLATARVRARQERMKVNQMVVTKKYTPSQSFLT